MPWLRARDESGSLAPAVPIIAIMLLALGGLGIDGSRQLNARGQAVAFAEEASRAGAQGVDLTQEQLTLDPDLVRDRVRTYCDRVLQLGQVTECRFDRIEQSTGNNSRPIVVVTSVKLDIQSTLLGIVGVRRLTASATAKARPYEGIDTAQE